MAIIKDNGIKCLGQFDGVTVYIKSAINKMFVDGKEREVVTGICFKDLDGNILYEQNNYNILLQIFLMQFYLLDYYLIYY